MDKPHKQQVTVISIVPNPINTRRWYVSWVEVNNPHGDTSSGISTAAADDELGALLEFRKWVADSNRGWEVVP